MSDVLLNAKLGAYLPFTARLFVDPFKFQDIYRTVKTTVLDILSCNLCLHSLSSILKNDSQESSVITLLLRRIIDARGGNERMEERSKASAGLQFVPDQKTLLHLHAAMHVDSFWQAVQDVIGAAFPTCFIGLTLQHSPISPRITKSTKKLPGSFFPTMPIKNYFSAHPRRNIVLISDFFRDECHFRRSSFYRSCMTPINGRCAIGLFFWDIGRLLAAIILVRNQQQGEPSPHEMRAIRNLHAHFKTALRRIRSEERDRGVLVAFGQFMRRVPLPTILLQWNLRLVYQNQAAKEFCALWQQGPSLARLTKLTAPVPLEILDRCGVLKKRWEQQRFFGVAPADFRSEILWHPTQRGLRAIISLTQISSAVVARPHFLIEFEILYGSAVTGYQTRASSLPHLVRLTSREQDLARLVCDGRSNQEIADETCLSLETVKTHLHSIFRKLEVPSRSRLVTLMLSNVPAIGASDVIAEAPFTSLEDRGLSTIKPVLDGWTYWFLGP